MESTRLSTRNFERKFFTYYPRMILAIQTNENMALTQSDLQRRINVTYSHLVESINEMVRMGLVSKMKKGRIAILTLTDDGKEMANLFLKIFPLVDKAKKKFG